MKLHHLGFATNDIENSRRFVMDSFSVKRKKGPVWDDRLKANLLLFHIAEGPSIEIVSGPAVNTFIEKGVRLYHHCYEVENINTSISKLKNSGASVFVKPTPAILFENRLVSFLMSPIGIIELLEA